MTPRLPPPCPRTRPAPLPLLLLPLAGLLLLAGCLAPRRAPGPALQRFEFNRPQMGVPFRIVVYAPDPARAQIAVDAAYARVARLNAVLSDYDPDSEINRLCHDTPVGQPVPVSPELWTMLARSRDLAARSDGAFDVTVGPLVNLWRRARRLRELPPDHLLAQARPRVGWQKLKLDRRRRTVTFLAPDMRLDFGGIAKGYAADEARRVLAGHGLTRVLIGAAGDVVAGDPPPDQPGWRIEIGSTDDAPASPPRFIHLRHAAVSTSGDLFQRLDIGGRRYSHILDPRTGIGLTDGALVTVLAPDATTADSLSTAVSVLGPDRGLALVRRTPGTSALILRPAPGGTNAAPIETLSTGRWRGQRLANP